MKLVSIQSPYAGDIECNVAYARRALHDAILRGEASFASHLLYTQVLMDDDRDERSFGLKCDYAFMAKCDLVAFYEDLGFSAGMALALAKANALNIPTTFRRIGA